MRYAFVLLLVFSTALSLLGCGGTGGYRDIALVAQAERSLTKIRTSLEEYYLDRGSYPGEGRDIGEALTPYFLRVVFYEGEEVGRYFVTITDAKNRFIRLKDFVRDYEAEMEKALTDSLEVAKLKAVLQEIRQASQTYESEIEQGRAAESSEYPAESFQRLTEMVAGLNLDLRYDSIGNLLLAKGDAVVSTLKLYRQYFEASLEDSSKREDIVGHILRADSLWLRHKEESAEAKAVQAGFPLEREIQSMRQILPEGDTLFATVEQLVREYRMLEQSRENIASFRAVQWKIERARDLLRDYGTDLRERAKRASVIVMGQQELKAVAEAIESYRGRKGVYPENWQDMEKFFQEELAETTAEQSAQNVYVLDHLAGPPLYSTSDRTKNFRVDARVKDEAQTPVFWDVRIVSEWSEVLATFSGPPLYSTIDSTITYFVRVKANDSVKTPLSIRPGVVREKVEEKTKKKRSA